MHTTAGPPQSLRGSCQRRRIIAKVAGRQPAKCYVGCQPANKPHKLEAPLGTSGF